MKVQDKSQNEVKMVITPKSGALSEVKAFLEAAGARVEKVVEGVLHVFANKRLVSHVQNHDAVQTATLETTKVEVPKVEVPKVEVPKVEVPVTPVNAVVNPTPVNVTSNPVDSVTPVYGETVPVETVKAENVPVQPVVPETPVVPVVETPVQPPVVQS